jgi:hypothetical protein
MDSYEYAYRITKDFEAQREISSYPSDAYGARRRFEEPKLFDFGLDYTGYTKCQRDYKEKADSRSKSGVFVFVTIIIIGIATGGFIGAIVGLFLGGFIVSSLFPDPKQSPALVNAKKYDQAIAEYKTAVECRARIIREREEKEKRKAEEEKRLKERLERQKEENYWLGLSPFEFEEEVALRLKQSGMVDEAKVTKKSGDDGIDIWAKKNGRDIIIQCKAYTAPVGIKEVRELLGVKIHENIQRAILVSRSTFTQSVSTFAQENGLELMELSDLVRLAGKRVAMNKKQATTDGGASFPFVTRRCAAINKSGVQCGLLALNESKYCHIHDFAKSKKPAKLKKW